MILVIVQAKNELEIPTKVFPKFLRSTVSQFGAQNATQEIRGEKKIRGALKIEQRASVT